MRRSVLCAAAAEPRQGWHVTRRQVAAVYAEALVRKQLAAAMEEIATEFRRSDVAKREAAVNYDRFVKRRMT